VVLTVEGRLGDVVEDLCWAIQLALAEGPRGVVCDLSRVVSRPRLRCSPRQGAMSATVRNRIPDCNARCVRQIGDVEQACNGEVFPRLH
jgi:hypothetical protein